MEAQNMPHLGQAGTVIFWRRAGRHARWVLLQATLAAVCAQTTQVTSLNGTWDFAFAADAAAADRLSGVYQDGFQGGGFRPIRSEEDTSELQSLRHLVCRLLL